jgi:hypothetical protein
MHFFTLLLISAMVACASHKVDLGPKDILVADDVVRLTGINLTDKGSKFHVVSLIKNEHEKSIMINLNDMTCSRGRVEGQIEGPKRLVLKPNQAVQFIPICKLPFEVEVGDFRISIKKIYETRAYTEITPGNLFAENIDWLIKSR